MIRSAILNALAATFAAWALVLAGAAPAFAQSAWDGVARVVVIGDLEGDYERFEDSLQDAGLIDRRGNWIGGQAHLVQLGDIPDRGPNSRRIMDHLMRLEGQAERAGGHVHALIGNHEAMNVAGDLRYVHPGEYAAFADRHSPRRRAAYYEQTLDYLRAHPPEGGLPVFDEAFRAQWEGEHPLGYVEHRIAWAANGTYGRWIARHDAVIRINDTLYVHGGLGPTYLAFDPDAMNRAVRAALEGEAETGVLGGVLDDQEGPLWYRGLALNDEAAESAHLGALLARYGVVRVVIGHTKRAPAVFPRFGGRVIIADIAELDGYPDPHAYVILERGAVSVVHRGARVPLRASTPADVCAYLAQIAALDPPNSPVARERVNCTP